jgi:hypothetical protein
MNDTNMVSILWYASWPIIIYFSYWVISMSVNVFEKKQTK